MNNIYFKLNGIKYLIKYENNRVYICKYKDNNIIELSSEEKKYIIEKLNKSNTNYIYTSELLNNLVSYNNGIDNKQYLINFLNWLEQNIPQKCLANFYRNVKNLRTTLNLDFINQENNHLPSEEQPNDISGGYNTRENKIIILESSLKELQEISKKTSNPDEFYWREYSQALLHELTHMASSYYNPNTGISICGFDKYPPSDEEDKNRGLTEGFTEIISMAGVPNTIEMASGYFIEASLINQLIQVVGNEVFIESYFSNLGIKGIKEKLEVLIQDTNKSFQLFRNIELNFQIRNFDEEQNILGNIQQTILEYLEKKLEILLENNDVDSIDRCLQAYEWVLITPDKLHIMKKNPQNYIGIEESLDKFRMLKQKYSVASIQDIPHHK